MRKQNLDILKDTLEIVKGRTYRTKQGVYAGLKLKPEQMKKCIVHLPEELQEISFKPYAQNIPMKVGCENIDAFTLAIRRTKEIKNECQEPPVLVLNLANSVHPGGGVRRGATAQEEDLCRRSTLLLALEGEEAEPYYAYNRHLKTMMGSDAIIITPNVEIIKDESGHLLDNTTIVSVMTCAAPMLMNGMEGMSEMQYEELVYHRILCMLKVAVLHGYRRLVLGAFGCGAFQNDARVVSNLFYNALNTYSSHGIPAKYLFQSVDFAVLCRPNHLYNYREFARNFYDFYGKQRNIDELDRVRGCLIGGAAGDALGYAVEFKREESIFACYGNNGITSYELIQGVAQISDDTQMTLFTAEGILNGKQRLEETGNFMHLRRSVLHAYKNWYLTQEMSFSEMQVDNMFYDRLKTSKLLCVPQMYKRRAPGNTCLSALYNTERISDDYIAHPVNRSKGCGGVMRIAPLPLLYRPGKNYPETIEKMDMEAAQLAAITHGHSLGYMPAAVLSHIISRIMIDGKNACLKDIVMDARKTVSELFATDQHLPELLEKIDLALELSENELDDLENIHLLGEGWVAEETIGIALYCALKYKSDFSAGIIAAVNHKGDSDSTGAVTGNILGALLGYSQIDKKWKTNLELHDILLEMADQLIK